VAALREGARGRRGVGGPGPDRFLAPDIAAAYALVRSGAIVAAAAAITGPLK
jgi:histidine ammonia-lyase